MSNYTAPTSPPPLGGIHHLKLPSSSLAATHAFYVSVLGCTPVPQYTHRRPGVAENDPNSAYAYIVRGPNETMIELRDAPDQAAAQKGWDPVTWAVQTQADLHAWAAWLDVKKTRHSPVLRGALGWVMVAEDPDGRFVRFYTIETHPWDKNPDWDEEWLGPKV